MPGAQLYLIRHAHTAANGLDANCVMSGWADLPLSSTGREQARQLCGELWSLAPFQRIYASPLVRARQTAEAVAELCASPVELCPDLREISCGRVDGLPIRYVRENFPAEWSENMRQENPNFRWPGGETYLEMRERSVRALDQIAERHAGEKVLVVTHCGVISQVAGMIHGISPARWECFRVENASWTELWWSNSGKYIRSFNRFVRDSLPVRIGPAQHAQAVGQGAACFGPIFQGAA